MLQMKPAGAHAPTRHCVHPDPQRIAGIAGAIAINVAVALLLFKPMQPPDGVRAIETETPYRWVLPAPRQPLPPPPPIEKIEPVKPTPMPTVRTPANPKPVVNDTTISTATDVVADATEHVDMLAEEVVVPAETGGASTGGSLAGARLGLADAPRPTYPRDALLQGIEGTVTLLVTVDANGKPIRVVVERSSGNRDLDETARRQVLRRWSFHPAIQNGQRVEASGTIDVVFSLNQ